MTRGGDTPGKETLFFAIKNSEVTYFCGKLKNGVFELYGPGNNKMFVVTDMMIKGATDGADAYLSTYAIPKIKKLGYAVNSYSIESNGLEVGDKIAEWDKYIIVS